MVKRYLLAALLALAPCAAGAQVGTGGSPTYCNASVIYDTNVLGTTQLIAPPALGGIYICGFLIGQNASAQTVTLNYSTGVGGVTSLATSFAVNVQALTPHLTPVLQFTSSTLGNPVQDNSSVFRGIYVPAGNGLNITTSASQQTQAIIYYYQQNPKQ